MFKRCPICRSDNCYLKYRLYDDRYGYEGDFDLYSCRECSHYWLDCIFSAGELKELYSRYYPGNIRMPGINSPALSKKEKRQKRITSSPFLSWLYGKRSSAAEWVPMNVRVLDIGCGTGGRFRHHLARGCDVYGVEANENLRGIIEKTGYKIHTGLFDPELYEPEFFDFVTMDQVVEHMFEPSSMLKGITEILKPGGKIVISTPNPRGWGALMFGKKWINWHAPYHVNLFSRQSLSRMVFHLDLEIIEHRTITDSKWLNMQWMHLANYPECGKLSIFWGKHLFNGDMPKPGNSRQALITFLDKSRINDLITRLFDIFNLGDNQIFILEKTGKL